jgi:hypothetical protein
MLTADDAEWDAFLARTINRMTMLAADMHNVPVELYAQAIVPLMGVIIATAISMSDDGQSLIDTLNEVFAAETDSSFRWRLVAQN